MKKDINTELAMEDYFIISVDKLELVDMQDFDYELYQLEYCENVLEIPIHLIDYTYLHENDFEIYLKKTIYSDIHEDDDWYFQLKNLSKYSRAS